MKILIIFLLLTISKPLFALEFVSGSYLGKLIYPDESEYIMESDFNIDVNNNVWGNYRYIYEGKFYEGVFYKGKFYEDGFLDIYWSDHFGEGWLTIEFDKSLKNFTGIWGVVENESRSESIAGTWSGKRKITNSHFFNLSERTWRQNF